MSENVVKTSDVAPVKVPKSFNDLNKLQLVAAAVAFGADESGTKEEIKADLVSLGVKFEDYLKAFHPTEKVVDEPEPFEMPVQVDVEDWPDAPEEVNEVTETIVTAPQVATLAPQEKYLIKFIGENPYFERGRYKFTQDKPYAIMPAASAQDALVEEPTKFRQAYPDELQEFYS